jgi:hypothetical protein
MNPRAISATAFQPWSMVRECPRSGTSTISVMASLCLARYFLGGVSDRGGCGVVALAGDDENRPPVGILGVDFGFPAEGVEVRDGCLEQWCA